MNLNNKLRVFKYKSKEKSFLKFRINDYEIGVKLRNILEFNKKYKNINYNEEN